MVGFVVLACVLAVTAPGLVAFRWWLDARERTAKAQAHQVEEALRLLPSQVVDLERRVRQLEVRPLGR